MCTKLPVDEPVAFVLETINLPSDWSNIADTATGLAQNISGQPKYADDTVYTVKQKYNSVSNSFVNYYYYWIKNSVFLPNIDKFGPWSGVNLKKGRPKVILIASNPCIVLIGVST